MRSPIRLLSITSLMAGVLVLGLFLLSGPAAVQHLTLDSPYILVRSDRVSRTVFDYTYRATITNPGPADYLGVTATLTSRSSRTVVVDGSLTFGGIPAGGTVTSSDTFTIRQDRSVSLNPTDLVWQIAGTLAPGNTPPVAHAGPDQTVVVGQIVTLDGSTSTDVDGDGVQYQWSLISVPTGSQAALTDATLVHPTFVVDRPGTYLVRLLVNDGTVHSTPDTVTITTTNSLPVAKAGQDQTVFVGTTVHLDGSASSDVDGDALLFTWSFTRVPSGSIAALSDPTVVQPSFLVDKPGTYVVELLVNDGVGSSAPALVTITTMNSRPVAHAGPDQLVALGQTVQLDGRTSSDVDGDRLSFRWSVLSQPPGGVPVSLSDPSAINPTFVANLPGAYVVQLMVHDGTEESLPDTVVITTQNSRPMANAGTDQSVAVASTVHLDGSASSDRDGDPLTYRWSFTSTPAGSVALLSDPTVVQPTFAVDLPGTYVAQLLVNDGQLDSAPDTVVITTQNSRPVAHAGPDQTVLVDATVQLDGSTSHDVDGDPLTFRWAFTTVPVGSTATLSNPTQVNPTFVVDKPGTYVVRLIVNDGTLDSAPATVTITTMNSRPVANAGPDQTVPVDTTVQLDGSASRDADGDALLYRWSLMAVPLGSAATLSDPRAVTPTFQVDLPGTYVAQLIVNDGTVDSPPDTVRITTGNSRPVANAGPDQTVFIGDTVHLDGSASSDADGDAVGYRWALTSVPGGSSATLADSTAGQPAFVVDLPGTYVAQLIVNDGAVDSLPDTVMLTTANRPPVLASLGNRSVVLGTTLVLQLTATDPDGDALTFAVDPLPANASLEATTARFTFTPVANQVGTLVLTFTVRDGNLTDEEPITITVVECPPPTIASIDPLTGPVGTEVTITGTNLNCGTAQTLTLNGVPAVLTSLSSTQITTIIPLGGQDGLFAFSTPGGTVTVPQTAAFDVVVSRDIALAVVPGGGQVLQGAATTYTVELRSPGAASFTGLAALAVTGVPSGVTATLGSPMLTGGQRTTLTVSADATAPVGTSTLTLHATTTVDTTPVTRTATVMLDVQAGGRTAVVGQFTFLDGTPLAGVKLTLGGTQTQTDSGGNFQLLDVPAGTHPLSVDTTPVHPQLPMYGMDVTPVAGQVTQLPAFRIHPPLPSERFTPIQNATQDQVIADPRYPGASFILPAGVTIIGWDGTPKTQMAIERLHPDALPVPPPPGFTRSVYQPFFGTPMGGLPSAPIPVTAPNDLDLKPGAKAELWYYDAAPFPGVPGAWRLAGMGTVSQDGSTIASDPGVGIQRFCGVCGLFCFIARQLGQPTRDPDDPTAGDPVDLYLGQMIIEKTDLVLPGRIPAVIHRTYNPLDPFGAIAGFELGLGPAWALSVEVVLQAETPSLRRLILPGNARFAFHGGANGTFVNTTNRHFAGAVLTAEAGGSHTLRFKNGTLWRFAPSVGIAGLSLLAEQTDRNSNRLTIDRDHSNHITRLIEPSGRELVLTYTAGRITEIRDPLGRTVRYGYDSNRRLETVTDQAGGVTRYTYNAFGTTILTITDARGITYLTNEYEEGRVISQTQADGGKWKFLVRYFLCPQISFDHGLSLKELLAIDDLRSQQEAGRELDCRHTRIHTLFFPGPEEVRVIDPRGHKTDYTGATGFTAKVRDALGQETRFQSASYGQVGAIHDPLGRVTGFEYDAAGNVTQITDPAGNIRRFEYEPTFDRLTKLIDPLGNITTFTYDPRGNLTSITDPLGQVTRVAYNAFGQPISTTDALGNITTFAYDAQGNLALITDPLGNTTAREYDAVSRLIAQTDPLGRTTTFTYDALNRITEIVDALNGITSFTYDANGNLLSVTDALGHTTTYEYDNMDRLMRRTDPVGASETFAYDPMGNLIHYTDRKGQVTSFDYDALNRRTEAQYADGTLTTFTYDAVGRLVQASDTAGGDVLHTYDVLDRLIQQTTGLGTVAYTYDALSRRASMRVSGQAPVTYSYDNNSRLMQLTQGAQVVDFAYDPLDRRTRLTLPNGVTTEYSYDAAFRLTELVYRNATGILGNLTYQYDASGNRTQVGGSFARTLLPDPVASASYDGANKQRTFGNKQMTFDANGNLTSITDPGGVTTLTWDARDQLIALTTSGITGSFKYDPFRRRATKQINGQITQYSYDGPDIVQEATNGRLINSLSSLDVDEPLVRNNAEHYLTDALGSSVALTDNAGNVQTEYTYEPFGKTAATGATTNPFQYTGRENDETGLYYYRARYYSSTLKRFLSEDPLNLLSGDINFYAYVFNDPISYIDPSGLGKIKTGIKVVKRIGDRLHVTRANVSTKEAQSVRKRGGDILAPNERVARQIEQGAFKKDPTAGDTLKHGPHNKGYRPHYQTDKKLGHTFYGITPATGNVVAGIPGKGGDFGWIAKELDLPLLGDIIDFYNGLTNPFSDIDDLLNLADDLSGRK